jgi:hypothetical protein
MYATWFISSSVLATTRSASECRRNGDTGDRYIGLDRFGRVVDQRWINTTTGTATEV